MYEFAAKGWNDHLTAKAWVLAISGSNIDAIILADEPDLVKVGYIIIALYNAVNAMFQLQPGFFRCDTDFILHGRKIGSMEIFSEASRPGANSGNTTSGNNAVNSLTTTAPQVYSEVVNAAFTKNRGNNTLRGTSVDPDDPKLTIEFEDGRPVPRQDLWTSVLDGMATAAQYDAGARCQFITAVSISGNLAIHINEVSNHLLSYRVAMKTFRLVALLSMSSRKYVEQEISMFYDGIKLAEGYVLKLGNAALEADNEPMSHE